MGFKAGFKRETEKRAENFKQRLFWKDKGGLSSFSLLDGCHREEGTRADGKDRLGGSKASSTQTGKEGPDHGDRGSTVW